MSRNALGFSLVVALLAAASAAGAQTKTVVRSVDDLPQSSYAVQGSVADILTAPPQRFEVLVAPMRADIDRILGGYDITDNATLRTLLQAKLGAQIASGKEDAAALATIAELRAHQDKAEARLIAVLAPQAFLEARLADHAAPGVCPHGFAAVYARRLDALPWPVVAAAETRLKGLAEVASPTFLIGLVAPDIEPTLDRAHALSSRPAWELMGARVDVDVVAPCRAAIVADTDAVIGKHAVQKPDIWAARQAVLPGTGLSPVPVAIWDSGFDPTLFPGQLLVSDKGGQVVAPAYDVDYQATQGPLAPLSAQDKAAYPGIAADMNGISDLQTGVDSPAAAAFRKRVATMSPARMHDFMQEVASLGPYMHGTHVAGIAARDNPAIRLASVRVTFDPKPVPTPPSNAMLQRIVAADSDTVGWLRIHHIRVVNMSWWDRPSSYEDALEKNGIGNTADERKKLARHYFDLERDGLYAALKSAPDILFVTIAGNNDSDNAFEETIPSSFRLPNLLVVGAVDQSGQQTNFTSTGQNIGVYANGYEVESVVPGGAKVRMSGTSMAAPAVTNLAAKLLAVDPGLTPEQLIAVITRTADPGETPAIRRLNPRLALASLRSAKPGTPAPPQ